jgi:hypothetical protein
MKWLELALGLTLLLSGLFSVPTAEAQEMSSMSSWFSPKTEKRTSPIEGRGLFARQPISAGEIVAVKGGAIMDSAAFVLVRAQVSPAEIQIEDDLYIAPRTAADVKAIFCVSTTLADRTSGSGVRSPSWRCRTFALVPS